MIHICMPVISHISCRLPSEMHNNNGNVEQVADSKRHNGKHRVL